MSDDVELVIDGMGAQGHGLAHSAGAKVFVPFTVPGDRVRVRLGQVRREGTAATVAAVVAPSPNRVGAACAHFGTCGGCDLQHWRPDQVLLWKRQQLAATLQQRGLNVAIEPVVATPAGERRRVRLAMRRAGDGSHVGFHERGSHSLVVVAACPLLAPALQGLLEPLRGIAPRILHRSEEAAVELTLSAEGVDVLLEQAREPTAAQRGIWAAWAAESSVARVSWRAAANSAPELLVLLRQPTATFGGIAVNLPPGTFLQASPTAERALVAEVIAAAGKARRAIDLFAGCGTFALQLLQSAAVHAVEGSAAAVAALKQAAGNRLTVEQRDLERRPLQKDELKKFDFAVLDPPRAGARAQSEALATSLVPEIAYVSCNPATFARDARTLIDGGYALTRVVPVDQFLWSAHVELVGIFRRGASGRRGS